MERNNDAYDMDRCDDTAEFYNEGEPIAHVWAYRIQLPLVQPDYGDDEIPL